MLKRRILFGLIGAALASGVAAQQYATIIDNLPTCVGNRNGRVISVSDAVDEADCTVGGAVGDARVVHQCICDTLNVLGPYWKSTAGSGGSSGPADALAPAVVIEGATADGFKGNFAFTDPTADWTWTWGATGNLTAGTGGTYTNPAFKLPGGAGGMYDDWGTGGVALAAAGATSFSVTIGGTYKLFLDADEFQLPAGTKFGWGAIGVAHDTGLARGGAGILNITDGGSGTGAIGKVSSITGGASGSSTLTLDGDSTVTGNATVSGAGLVSATGGFYARTDQLGGGAILLAIGSAGTGNMTVCSGACTWAGMDNSALVLNASDLGLYTSTSAVAWEGTDNAYETRLVATDPTADRTITLPNATGTVGTFAAAPAAATDACVAGQYAVATGFAYFCVATDTWQRVAIATW